MNELFQSFLENWHEIIGSYWYFFSTFFVFIISGGLWMLAIKYIVIFGKNIYEKAEESGSPVCKILSMINCIMLTGVIIFLTSILVAFLRAFFKI